MTARAPQGSSHDCEPCPLGPRLSEVERVQSEHADRLDGHDADITDARKIIGREPSTILGPGDGILAAIAGLQTDSKEIKSGVAAILATHERRKEPWSKIGWLFLAAVVVIVVQEGSRFAHGIRYVPTTEQQGKP